MAGSKVVFPDSFLLRIRGLQRANRDAGREVMPALERIAWEDNRDGLLASTDKDGRPLAPLSAATLKDRARGSGGPLVPRGRQSRAIANYRVTSFQRQDGNWVLLGAWQNVLSRRGVPFLGFHAEGRGHLPVRDIFGVRPTGKQKIQAAMKAWLLSRWSGK